MKFRVVGSSKETGARMTLEFEAQSKAAAERKAQVQGMAVNRVEVMGDGVDARPVRLIRPRRNWLARLVVLIVIGTGVFYWLHSRGIIR